MNSSRAGGSHSTARSKMAFTCCQRSAVMRIRTGKLPVQPGFCRSPLTFDRDGGDAHDLGRLFHIQAGEEAQFDQPCLPWIDLCEPFEYLVDRDYLFEGI